MKALVKQKVHDGRPLFFFLRQPTEWMFFFSGRGAKAGVAELIPGVLSGHLGVFFQVSERVLCAAEKRGGSVIVAMMIILGNTLGGQGEREKEG